MNKIIAISVAVLCVVAPLAAQAHGYHAPVSCEVPVPAAAPSGGGLMFGSGPMAPGWNVSLPDGGQGGATYVPYNGTTCLFNQGCMLPQ